MSDDLAERLRKAQAVIHAERALRVKAEHQLRAAQNEIRQLRYNVAMLRRRLDAQSEKVGQVEVGR